MLLGTVLVLLTWTFWLLVVAALGRLVASWLGRSIAADHRWRASLWWGLVMLTALVLLTSLLMPLGALSSMMVVFGVAVVAGLISLAVRPLSWATMKRPSRVVTSLLLALGLAIVYLAYKALGPVTNYDTGLYHLGSVKYAGDFAAVPGLANLFAPFGYANAQFPLAALLGNGPWDGQGFRLLNGLILVLAVMDLVSRLLRGRWSWGTYVLLVGLSASLIPLVAMADSLVASPTSDTSVLLLTVLAGTYLCDALSARRSQAIDGSVTVALSGLVVALRPTMAFFSLAAVVVIAIVWFRGPDRVGNRSAAVCSAGALAVLGLLVVLRDRMLSGWILYPLSLLPLDVPWRAEDPTTLRDATLAAARDPGAPDQYVVAHSWGWIPAWLSRLPQQWEFWFLLIGLLVTLVITVIAQRRVGGVWTARRLWLALTPSIVAVTAWFTLSPPSFRFIWGPLFNLLFIPLGLGVLRWDRARNCVPSRMHIAPRRLLLLGTAGCIVAISVISIGWRNQGDSYTVTRSWSVGPVSLPIVVAPIPLPPVEERLMTTGLTVLTPLPESDQCWDNYPLCTFNPPPDIGLRGATIGEGFVRE